MFSTLKFIVNHPLNKKRKVRSVLNFFLWQVSSRYQREPVEKKFVDDTKFWVRKGMTGITGNLYVGLHDFEDMSFVLHFLRPEDTFVDIGSNVGSYSLLASGVVKAQTIAFEPDPQNFKYLSKNIALNKIQHLASAHNIGLGNKKSELLFSSNFDAMNHIIERDEQKEQHVKANLVKVERLDAVLTQQSPTLMKIDVEGYEVPVIEGAKSILEQPGLKALIIELKGNGMNRYGYDENEAKQYLMRIGFKPYYYDPFQRSLTLLNDKNKDTSAKNEIYIRDINFVMERIQSARKININGISY